jgi:transcriptional regulator with XRE-family HTH domain
MTFTLRGARLNRGLSLRAAAKEIGVDMHALWRAEHGAVPNPASAKKIADFYGAQVTEIWPVSDETVAA